MELVYSKGEVTVADIHGAMPDDVSYSSVRAQMAILERKGFLKHKKNGRAFVYTPTVDRSKASRAALKQVVNTFFDGSVENVVAALINIKNSDLSDDEYERLRKLIDTMREKESGK